MKFSVFGRPVSVIFLWITLPVMFYAQALPFSTQEALRRLEHVNDTARIDLLLKLSEELLTGQPDKAFVYAQEALKLSEDRKDAYRTGLSCRAVAECYHVTAVYDKALEFSLTALKHFTRLRDSAMIAKCYNAIGYIHMSSGDYQQAQSGYTKSLKINKAIGCHSQIAINYMNMGLNCLKTDSVDKGLSYFLVSLMIADSLHMEPEKILLMKNLGYAYARLGRQEDALGHFYRVLELLGNKPDEITRSDAQLNIAKGYFELKNEDAALKYAMISFETARNRHFYRIYRDAAELISEIYARKGNYKEAYTYVRIFHSVSDSILNAEKIAQLARLQTLYNVNLKEEENISLRNQIFENLKRVRTRTYVIIIITLLVLVLASLLYMLNRMNNKEIALNKKLAAQSHELEALNDLKDKFFSFVAHNLKNPFNTIMGFSELMHRAVDAKDLQKAHEYSGLIYNLSTQVQKVLSNLLEWSRLQRRTFEVKPENVEINSLIKDVVEMNNREAARKDIHMQLQSDGNVFVFADRSMITAVLQNLVTNAIHFTPPSGRISIDCKVKNQFTEVTITDTGIGIPEDNQKTLFDFDFSQGRISSSDHQGTGLGLVICHEMLVKNGGSISVKSKLGKGSTFTFTLPVAIRHDGVQPEPEKHLEDTPVDVARTLIQSDTDLSPALFEVLKNTIVPLFEEVTKVMSVEDLENLAKTIIHTGEKFEHPQLTAYGKSLHSLTMGHQIDQIIRILPKFREFLQKNGVL